MRDVLAVLLVARKGHSCLAGASVVTGFLVAGVSFLGDRSLNEGSPFGWDSVFLGVAPLIVVGVLPCRGDVGGDGRFPPRP